MTAKTIENQIVVIQNATNKANSSKKSAVTFLRNAGIIKNDSNGDKFLAEALQPGPKKV